MSALVQNPYCVAPPCNFKPLRNKMALSNSPNTKHISHPPACLPLRSVIPSSFADMYTPDILENKSLLTKDGRPMFTQRELVDWHKNDLRSLLIVSSLKPAWRGKVPHIIEPGYRVMVLPLDASDQVIVQTLVSSDLYKEHRFEQQFLEQTAEYTVQAARQRTSHQVLTKPEWRNIVENYLLNLACEAQCRLDFKEACSDLKRQKRKEAAKECVSSKGSVQDDASNGMVGHKPITGSFKSTSPLLKQAILTRLSTSPDYSSMLNSRGGIQHQPVAKPKVSTSLTRQEKQRIWVDVQAQLYARLGLNWLPDELI